MLVLVLTRQARITRGKSAGAKFWGCVRDVEGAILDDIDISPDLLPW